MFETGSKTEQLALILALGAMYMITAAAGKIIVDKLTAPKQE